MGMLEMFYDNNEAAEAFALRGELPEDMVLEAVDNGIVELTPLQNICVIHLQETMTGEGEAKAEVVSWDRVRQIKFARQCGHKVSMTGQLI